MPWRRPPASDCSGKGKGCMETKIAGEKKIVKWLSGSMVAINVGLSQFAKTLEEQGVEVVQVDWVPPAGGDKEMMDLLENLL